MEDESQASPSSEPSSGGTAASPASAPSSPSGPTSWEVAFAEAEDGASNRDVDRPAARTDATASADPAASGDAAQEATTPGGQRDPQPGSRRSTAAENATLREQVRAIQAELEAERQQAAEGQRVTEEAASFADGLVGKPGELAGLLAKEADQGWLDVEDNERKLALIRGARAYQPLLERARAEAAQGVAPELTAARGQSQALLDAWAGQFEAAIKLGLPHLDEQTLRGAADLPAIVKAAHAAGATSRDDEITDLKGRLDDARGRAFASQPRLAAGGVSGSGRSTPGYDPTRSPISNLEDAFAEPSRTNGRR